MKTEPIPPPRVEPAMNSAETIAPTAWPPKDYTDRLTHSFAGLGNAFYTRVEAAAVPSPTSVAASADAAALVGIDPSAFESRNFVETFAGNRPLPGGDSLAAVYSGHQFGVWAGQLGDGRALLIGEIDGPAGRWEMQLKGAGKTPYSPFADGRAVLRSSIREFLCSEAMAALGVPTTRSLCVVASPLPVRRETLETAAIATRLAPSFIRFGSFEHWAAADRHSELKQLADYVIDNFMPEARRATNPYQALLSEVARRTALMVAHWQTVGFMHGVMNTDNMSILGLTLDYGPFGFMEAFDANHICNHTDEAGRYAYHRQPQIAFWNLQALGHALMPLIGDRAAVNAALADTYTLAYNNTFSTNMRDKLGLAISDLSDDALIESLFGLLQSSHADFAQFFRKLSMLPAVADVKTREVIDAPVRDLFIDRNACDAWLAQWRARLAIESSQDDERQARMLAVNPKYVLRNWVAEEAIRAAQNNDYSIVRAVLQCLRRPFYEQPEFARWSEPPPAWAEHLEVSCSS